LAKLSQERSEVELDDVARAASALAVLPHARKRRAASSQRSAAALA
jgi:hypothetical protein